MNQNLNEGSVIISFKIYRNASKNHLKLSKLRYLKLNLKCRRIKYHWQFICLSQKRKKNKTKDKCQIVAVANYSGFHLGLLLTSPFHVPIIAHHVNSLLKFCSSSIFLLYNHQLIQGFSQTIQKSSGNFNVIKIISAYLRGNRT